MTKYEWERQLKKGISGLPKAEQQRVLEYYNELFADKIDAGLREQYIISEFGNPYDVANKILVDYYNGDKENPEVDAYIYADSDDIDEAFDEPEPVTYAEPSRKEKRDNKRVEYRGDRAERVTTKREKIGKSIKSASGLIALICVIIFFVMGACFNLWHPAWLIFLLMPSLISLIQAIIQRNWRIFAYPVFITFAYLALGFSHHAWHPAWILFLTIPLYYVLGSFIEKNVNSNDKKGNGEEIRKQRVEQEVEPKQTVKETKRKEKKSSSGVIVTIAKVLLAICLVGLAIAVWSAVIGLFIGGIGMIIGGIGCIVAAAVGIAGTSTLLVVGVALAILGLGLICAFGMSALFKPCANMCKAFINTIKGCFADKEAE